MFGGIIGPNLKQMKAAAWHHTILGWTQEEDGTPSQLVVGHVAVWPCLCPPSATSHFGTDAPKNMLSTSYLPPEFCSMADLNAFVRCVVMRRGNMPPLVAMSYCISPGSTAILPEWQQCPEGSGNVILQWC